MGVDTVGITWCLLTILVGVEVVEKVLEIWHIECGTGSMPQPTVYELTLSTCPYRGIWSIKKN